MACPSASVEEVHPVDRTWLGPRRPKRMDSSLLIVPGVEEGITYRLTALGFPM